MAGLPIPGCMNSGHVWRKNHRTHVGRACVVDLNEVTFIDKSGERVLCKLAKEGAQFTASGTYHEAHS